MKKQTKKKVIVKKGKRYKKRKLNKKRVFLALIIFVGLIYSIIKMIVGGIQKVEQQEQIQETVGQAEQEEQEEVIIEPSEDESIKQLVQTEQAKYNLTEKNFGFFYYRIQDKKYYFYNENKTFTAASTVKVPVAMIYYDKINQGELTLESTLTYSSGTYEAGGGSTAAMYKIGQKIPISFLLQQSIVNSDNTAVNILIKNLGWKDYRYEIAQYSEKKETIPQEFYGSNLITPSFGFDLVEHIYENQEQYTQLIEDMKKSSGGQYLKKYITQYDVAHKYGSYSGNVHDYGMVLSEEPYLIGIFTKNVSNADEVIAQMSLDVLNETKNIQIEVQQGGN